MWLMPLNLHLKISKMVKTVYVFYRNFLNDFKNQGSNYAMTLV